MMSADLREELKCPICLEIYTEPVSLRCGHNFCQSCIVTALDTQEESGVYSCPECREEHAERPQLEKNRKLCNIVEHFQPTESKQETSQILCTYCDSPAPATKSCLQCETSFCSKHLKNHNMSVNHDLSEPISSFTDRKCSIHKEVLKYYCQDDKDCICMSCVVLGEHKTHRVQSLSEAVKKKKRKIKDAPKKINFQIHEIESRIQNLHDHGAAEKTKAADLTKRVAEMFSEIKKDLEDLENEVQSEISRQEEQISQAVSDVIQELEKEKADLSEKLKRVEELRQVTDPLTILKEMRSYDITPKKGSMKSDRKIAGCQEDGIISKMLHTGLRHISTILTDIMNKSKFGVQLDFEIFLNINTANNDIAIENMCLAYHVDEEQKRPDGPERFACSQVLSGERFIAGRFFWLVDVSQAEEWLIGMAAESIERKIVGNASFIGYNDKSWSLTQRTTEQQGPRITAQHNNETEEVDLNCSINRVGIYLDYDAGRLSFYQMCHPIRHLHTFTTTFTEPLHAAFFLFEDSRILLQRQMY